MDQKELHELEARCIQEEPPGCRAGCPLGVDARGFALAMAKDDLPGARAILEKTMPLAGIVARMCEAPCERYCKRETIGGPVALGLLERLCIETVPSKAKFFKLPPKAKKVAVIGAGPSSLTVAHDLAKKGHPVHLYHTGEGPGAWLRHLESEVLSEEVLAQELERLKSFGVVFSKAEKLDASLCKDEYEAFYIGTDDGIEQALVAHLGPVDSETFSLEKTGWFSGGVQEEAAPNRFILSVSQGREAAVSIDRFLQGASLTAARVPLRHGKTSLYTSLEGIASVPRLVPANGKAYTREEALQEAARCINCQCLECVKHCKYLEDFGAYPKTYARRVYNNSAIVKGNHQANRFINSCSLCGQCETICPNDFSMAELCLTARKLMVKEDRMPGSAHWFALEEMRSARKEGALVSHAPGQESSTTIFYPGCQLSGIRPEQTLSLYDYLRQLNPATGLWLDCCGAPAHWGGRETEFAEVTEETKETWEKMGKPEILTACSSCLQMFRDHLPDLPVASVWSVLAEHPPKSGPSDLSFALSDPCTSRHDSKTRKDVRDLLKAIGQDLSPLPMSGELTECCGFGGLMQSANPQVAKKVVEARVAQTDAPILTYCAMCRDQLARSGKPVAHVLDLLFADSAQTMTQAPPSISDRRVQRRNLKNRFLTSYLGQSPQDSEPWEKIELLIEDQVATLLEERRILRDDIRKVLYSMQQSSSFFVHNTSGSRVASAVLGQVTFWLQYREEGGVFTILNGWSHRMRITGGGK